MDIRLVHQQNRPFRLVRQRVLDVLVAGDRPRRVVRVADVEDPRIGIGGNHRSHIVRIILRQRNLHDVRPAHLGRVQGRFIAGVGDHQAALLRREGQRRVVQGLARSGIRDDVSGLEPFHGGESVHQFLCQLEVVAPAFRQQAAHHRARAATRPQRILIRVDANRARRQDARNAGPLRLRQLRGDVTAARKLLAAAGYQPA